jgi:hypothetical protein
MIEDNKHIAGSGGGGKGGGGDPPFITPDNLHSKQFATLLDLISEGEIEGFSSPSKEKCCKERYFFR